MAVILIVRVSNIPNGSLMFKFIDLFCGIGGFHQAMSDLGGQCVYACDIDSDCRDVYFKNYGLMPDSDITSVNEKSIPDHDVLCAGFPCQSFSKAGNRLGFSDSTKGTLFFDVMRIACCKKPKFMLLENVRNLASHDGGNTWRIIKETIRNAGYNVDNEPVIFSPHQIGIPQHRERVFIMCVRKDIGEVPKFDFDDFNQACSVETILQDDSEIADIEKYRLDERTISWIGLWNEFIKNIKCEKLPGFPVWVEYFDKPVPNNAPDWKRKIIDKNSRLYATNKEFIDCWLIKARRNPMFFGAKAKLEWQAGDVSEPDIWNYILQMRPSGIRVKRNDFFPALVAMNQTSIVGSRKRKITPRECARLQSFPDSFVMSENENEAYKQFGNSVNVEVVKMFAKILLPEIIP